MVVHAPRVPRRSRRLLPDIFLPWRAGICVPAESSESGRVPCQPGEGGTDVPAFILRDQRSADAGGEMISRMQGFERDTLRAVWKHKLIWLIHVVMNALLFVAFFYWLQIKEETGFQFALTVIGGALIAFLTLWLHSATFDFFHDAMDPAATKPPCFRISARETLRRIPAFLVWTLIFGFMLWLISQLWTYDEQIGGWARHAFPEFLRR